MEVGSGEVLRIASRVAMLAVGRIAVENRGKQRILKESVSQRVEERSKTADGGGKQQPARRKDSERFLETRDSVLTLGEVIKRAEKENGIHGAIRFFQVARVSHRHARDRVLLARRPAACLLNVFGNKVQQMHFVAQ